MTAFVFPNYLNTTLAVATASSSNSFTLASAANLPTLAPGQVMPMTLNDAATGLVYEIVYVTAISGTTLTALRAQEGTSAQNWGAGDMAFTGPTGGTDAPVIGTHSPVASETLFNANQLIVTPGTLTADIDLTLPSAPAQGTHYRIFGSTSAFTVTVKTGVTTGTPNIGLPDQSVIYSWVISASMNMQGIDLVFDGTNWRGVTFGQTVVAPATASNDAVNLGQLATLNLTQVATPTASETLPVAPSLIVLPGTLTAAITLTLPTAPSTGAKYTIFGSASAFAVTVASSVTTGSPFIGLPDDSSVYSWVIPASADMQGVSLIYDGTNWRASTFGQTVMADAVANNEGVTLGQLNAVSFPYDVAGGFAGAGTASQIVLDYASVRSITFPANFAGSVGVAGTAATAATTYNIEVNGTVEGTLAFAASGTTATFTSSGGAAVNVVSGDILSVVGPATADTTLANVTFTLLGSAS